MMVRTSALIHKSSGMVFDTPLLIPSFSSKGLKVISSSSSKSHVGQQLQVASEFITTYYLISAYDLAKGYIPKPWDLQGRPELTVIDSGGYEISEHSDYSEITYAMPHDPTTWTLNELEKTLDQWPETLPAIFVSFDHPKEMKLLEDQLTAARELFKRRRHQLSCFLIKPEPDAGLVTVIGKAIGMAREFVSFDVVGITEKGLGNSALDRMHNIARLRRALDESGVTAPLHVFGSLDPVSITLYFIAGAEIFDGLTWLRFAFHDDQCGYKHSYATREFGISSKDSSQIMRLLSHNYYYLESLTQRLRHFATNKEFNKLPHPEFMKDASEHLQRVMKGRNHG